MCCAPASEDGETVDLGGCGFSLQTVLSAPGGLLQGVCLLALQTHSVQEQTCPLRPLLHHSCLSSCVNGATVL